MKTEADWHAIAADTVCRLLETEPSGLSAEEAQARIDRFGENVIDEMRQRPLWRMLAEQFTDLLIIVLLAAALVSGLVGEAKDSVIILVIVVLNGLVGVFQEYRAEKALAALRSMVAAEALVVRDGMARKVAGRELVPGDIVLLEAGAAVPADLRLMEGAELQIDESLLTGESQQIEKSPGLVLASDTVLGDRKNVAFKGTLVTRGRGRGVVVATGMATEIGRIASLLGEAEALRTPLQRRLAHFGSRLTVSILVLCLVIFLLGLMRGEPVVLMFLTAVSLAVAAIPEALPAVITVALALGASRMSRVNALARRLPAVETLGSVTYICSDKTGTLTQNRMHLEHVQLGAQSFQHVPRDSGPQADMLGMILALSNDVEAGDGKCVVGEPTEVACYEAAAASGFCKDELLRSWPRLAELTFDSERKRMSTLHRKGEGVLLLTKGAPESVIPLCGCMFGGTPLAQDELLAEAERLAGQGYRVLALACRQLEGVPEVFGPGVERDLELVGLVGLIDPPREGVKAAVAECKQAGIVPVMITGDHPGTARSIAHRLGIATDGDPILTGRELREMSDQELVRVIEGVSVFARVDPEQKIRIVRALQKRGQYIAMTGDGVNDAPALKQSDIGVAMGLKGTDVAREAADLVLLDDNFATIVRAVREGRRIYDNIRKFIKYTMTSNSGEIWTLLMAPFFGLPIPLLPVHILWINLVTDGLPGLAFTAERAERGTMQRPPRPPDESIFAHGMWQHIVWVGLLIGGLSIAGQAWAIWRGVDYWQTVVFTILTLSQLFHCMAIRSERDSLFVIGVFSNTQMLIAVLFTIGLQFLVIYTPLLNGVFNTRPLPLLDLVVCFAIASLTLVAVETEKFLARRGLIYREPARPPVRFQAG